MLRIKNIFYSWPVFVYSRLEKKLIINAYNNFDKQYTTIVVYKKIKTLLL